MEIVKTKPDVKYKRNKDNTRDEVWNVYVDGKLMGSIEKPINQTRVFVTMNNKHSLYHFSDVRTAKSYVKDRINDFI